MSVIRESSNQVRNQLQDALATMSTPSRVVSLVLAVLVIVGLGFLVRGDQSSSTEMLFGGRSLSEQELDSVEMSFSHAGLSKWKREGRRISVPAETRSDYLAALQDSSSLPVSIRSSVQTAIDNTTIFESSGQRLAREMHAKEQDLGSKLSAFPEIRWASVEYDQGERQGFGRVRTQSASVVVWPEGSVPLTHGRIQAIKEFIRGSYAAMNSEDVVVTDTNANSLVGQTDDPRVQKQQEEAARVEQKVREILSGYGPIRVSAYVDLSPSPSTHVAPQGSTSSIEDVQVVRRPTSRTSDDGKLLSSIFEAVTQVRSNRATRIEQPATPTSTAPSNTAPTNTTSTNTAPPTIAVSTTTPAPQVQSVRVSVGLPESYYHRVWEYSFLRDHPQQTLNDIPPIDAAQLQQLKQQTTVNIQAAVTPAILAASPYESQTSSAIKSAVQVWNYPDLPTVEIVKPDLAAVSLAWLNQHWQQIAMVLVGFVGVCIVLRTLSPKPQAKSAAIAHELSSVAPSSHPTDSLNQVERYQPAEPSPTTEPYSPAVPAEQEDLLALVEANPDAAANVIRDWIVKAA